MRCLERIGLVFAFLTLVGCSSESLVVTGTVTQKDKPVPHAVVTFHPKTTATPGLGGHGKTDADGKYTLTGARGEKGLAPGEYTVTISLYLQPDGSPGDPAVPPIENTASEKLPKKYCDRDESELSAKVAKDALVHDFKLEATPKTR